MSILREQNFGFGAGLTALFDHNPGIMPSFIEDVTVTEMNGKKTKVTNGKFFRIQTPNGNEFIIYIKYSDKLIKNDNMVSGFMWEFSLTDIEKDKIEFHYEKTGTFLILLVCINKTDIKLDDQVALLQWDDYCEIRGRSNIQIGIWRNQEAKTQRSKMYCLRKGKGQRKEFFVTIKRNLIEKKLDELNFNEPKNINITSESSVENEIESNYVELKPERITKKTKQSAEKIYVKDNITWCGLCRCKTEKSKSKFTSIKGKEETEKIIYGYKCPKCNKTYISTVTYESEIKEKVNLNTIVVQRIKTLVDKVYLTPEYGCVRCDDSLVVSPCKLKIYVNIGKNNKVEQTVDEELFYCKNCGLYYATPQLHQNLLKKYGRNKVNLITTENIQRVFSLL